MFSGRSVSQRRRNRSGFISHSSACSSPASWHRLLFSSVDSSVRPTQDFLRPSLPLFEFLTPSRSALWGFSAALKYALTYFLPASYQSSDVTPFRPPRLTPGVITDKYPKNNAGGTTKRLGWVVISCYDRKELWFKSGKMRSMSLSMSYR